MRLFLFILIFLQGSGLPPPGFSDGHSDELQSPANLPLISPLISPPGCGSCPSRGQTSHIDKQEVQEQNKMMKEFLDMTLGHGLLDMTSW